ncbi:xanthine dehydrogenase family protein subunit M [Pikeienuella piscinae]|uniref:Xanthine dehydrogenase family protein subunit M n=1 Tax=Pikeienuella piscinae TaxID=2748098 RepID=A0A7L5BZK8_9RHOB|nr:xanthine dehydrogenase family protein subunit M [Pikeienuella piscinae]QIE55957.1 xanthine dehydrogenase family protein subunit M [Pikeienuella piscinae]
MYDFEYVKAGSVSDALKALSAGDAQPISGGQTLIPTLRARLGQPSALVDLSKIAELKGIEVSGGKVKIGGASTHHEVAESADVKGAIPALAALAGHIGDPAVRHRGTLGGSVANNDPSACYPAACLALDAAIHTSAGDVAADDFFQGMFDTALEEGQIVTGVSFAVPEAANYQKFVQPASRFALVGVFVAKSASGVRVAVTGASEGGVFRWTEAEEALSGKFSPDAVPAAPPADGMIGDLHGSPEYRAHLVMVMTKRAVAAC